ncbi:discoidin domain-containing protein [Planomonospora corallina]|uniref:beta-N-acetylhexosaminidase n=1 Tax=Planomonospora corallina TaxID=1806052 RepID=A0ABV8I8M1_9ACTN
MIVSAAALALAAVAVPAGAQGPDVPPPVAVPAPAGWTAGDGVFRLAEGSRVLARAEAAEEAGRLAEDLREVTGRDVPVVVLPEAERTAGEPETGEQAAAGPAAGDVVLTLRADRAVATAGVRGDDGTAAEAYALEVGDHVEIEASTPAGIFYGGRTLLQALRASGEVPHGTVEDRPDVGRRVLVLDLQAGFRSPEWIGDLVRRMSWMKLNTLHLRLSGDAALRLRGGAAGADGAFSGAVPARHYDRAGIEAVQEVARRHHVTVVPEFDVLGDAAALTPSRRCGGEHVPDLADPAVRRELAAVLDAFAEWFEAPLLGLGRVDACDEPGWLDGARELAAHAETLGKRPVLRVRDRVPPLDGEPVILNEGAPESVRTGGHDVIDAFPAAGSHGGDLLAWTPQAGRLGQALVAEAVFFGDPEASEEALAGPRAEFAERSWNRLASAEGFAARVGAVGDAPGAAPREAPAPEAEHRYDFDRAHLPDGETHVAAAWREGLLVTAADSTGGVHATAVAHPAGEAGDGTAGQDTGGAGTADQATEGDGAAGRATPLFPVDGRVGKAARFGDGRRFLLGAASTGAPWTVSMWVRLEDRARGVLLGRLDEAIAVEDGEVLVSGAREFSFGYRLPLERWTHLVLAADPHGTTLYVNGRRTGRVPEVIGLPTGSMGPFRGALDEVVLARGALTAAQAAERYLADSEGPDLARGRPATASGVEAEGLGPENAVDGDPATRWASPLRVDPQWIGVDLGESRDVSRVVLRWERAYGARYRIEGSVDGASWTTIREVAGGDGGTDDLGGLSATARYIRVYGMKRGTKWGYSLIDLAVYGG